MGEREALEKWAQTADFPLPVRWGDIEDEVLARRIRPLEGASLVQKVMFWPGVAVVYLLALLLYGGAAIGLGLVVLGTYIDTSERGEVWLVVAQVAFLGSVAACSVTMLLQWWESRLRSAPELTLTGGSGALSLAALAILYSDQGEFSRSVIIALLATAVGLAGFAAMLFGSKGTGSGGFWIPSPESRESRYSSARNRVLRILLERGIVDVPYDRRMRMIKMPLGTWRELDGPPESQQARG